jgi:hypothetical protein
LGTLESQNFALYQDSPSLLTLSPTIKLGAFHHVQLDVTAPFVTGPNEPNAGAVGADGYYQFNDPTPGFPALALQAGSTFGNYGPTRLPNTYFLRGLLTQWLGPDSNAPRLDLNINYTYIPNPLPGDRRDVFGFGVGYTQRLNDQTAFVGEVVHDYLSANGKSENFVDGGLRYIVGGGWTVSGVIGPGFAENSPAFRMIFVVQKDFDVTGILTPRH